jgi:epidermal growth factor receptor substrate 15
MMIMSSVFSPTPPELAVVSQIFAQADPQKTGVLTGDVAVRVFGGDKLPPTTLGTIWNISDEDDKGWLAKRGVAIAVRLIGWAQKGEKITKDLVNKRNPALTLSSSCCCFAHDVILIAGPLAVIEGINTVSQQNTGMSLPKSPPPTPYPLLTAQDKAKFHSLFMKNNPVNSLMSGLCCFFSIYIRHLFVLELGEKARDIFVKSKLSNEQLMKIWCAMKLVLIVDLN